MKIGNQITSSILDIRAQLILRIALAFQAMAYGAIVLQVGSSIGNYMFLTLDMNETVVSFADKSLAFLAIASGLMLLIRWSSIALWFIGGWGLVEAVADAFYSGNVHRELTLLTHVARYLVPLAIAYMLTYRKTSALRILAIVKGAIAVTFISHGIKALLHQPLFIDFIITASDRLLGFSLMQKNAELILLVIGMVDIAIGVALLVAPWRWVSVYMLTWILITSLARITYWPDIHGILEVTLRSVNFALPLILLLGHSTLNVEGEETREIVAVKM